MPLLRMPAGGKLADPSTGGGIDDAFAVDAGRCGEMADPSTGGGIDDAFAVDAGRCGEMADPSTGGGIDDAFAVDAGGPGVAAGMADWEWRMGRAVRNAAGNSRDVAAGNGEWEGLETAAATGHWEYRKMETRDWLLDRAGTGRGEWQRGMDAIGCRHWRLRTGGSGGRLFGDIVVRWGEHAVSAFGCGIGPGAAVMAVEFFFLDKPFFVLLPMHLCIALPLTVRPFWGWFSCGSFSPMKNKKMLNVPYYK